MIKTGCRTFLLIVLVAILYSCSTFLKSPKALYIHSLSRNEQNSSPRIWQSNYYFYDSTCTMVHEITITTNDDSVVKGISLSLGNSESSYNSFSASWDKIPPVKNPVQINRNFGIPLDVYSQETRERNTKLPKDESLQFYYFFADTSNGFSYTFEHESDGGYIGLNEVTIKYESDSLTYERILDISPEIIEFFRQMILEYGDSIDLTILPAVPDLRNCSLKESNYTIVESSDSLLGNIKEINIDSLLVDGNYEVHRTEDFYFLFEELDAEGAYKFKRYTTSFYSEAHYLPNEVRPYYDLKYYLSPNGMDTTFKSELTVSRDGRLYRYKIVQTGHLSQKSGSRDLRIPIVKREMYFWFNPRKSKIVRKHYVAYTDQNHRLEKEWINAPSYKIITLLDTIPEVSGSQKYDIVPTDAHVPQYPYFNSLSAKKHKSSRKSEHYYTRNMLKNLRKRTTELEKDRSKGYEKRIAADSSEIYEIYYAK